MAVVHQPRTPSPSLLRSPDRRKRQGSFVGWRLGKGKTEETLCRGRPARYVSCATTSHRQLTTDTQQTRPTLTPTTTDHSGEPRHQHPIPATATARQRPKPTPTATTSPGHPTSTTRADDARHSCHAIVVCAMSCDVACAASGSLTVTQTPTAALSGKFPMQHLDVID